MMILADLDGPWEDVEVIIRPPDYGDVGDPPGRVLPIAAAEELIDQHGGMRELTNLPVDYPE